MPVSMNWKKMKVFKQLVEYEALYKFEVWLKLRNLRNFRNDRILKVYLYIMFCTDSYVYSMYKNDAMVGEKRLK